ncbi:MAG: phosphoribosylpyrophosphate synthetase [Bacteroidia bacterium]|nr:phosphoribosylpyrophosphate synthetase [Bacteroidia bacterium]
MELPDYTSLSDATDDLLKRGFTISFTSNDYKKLIPADWIIVEFHRFEGMSNVSDNNIVYGIENTQTGEKAIIVNAYGLYHDPIINNFTRQLKKR